MLVKSLRLCSPCFQVPVECVTLCDSKDSEVSPWCPEAAVPLPRRRDHIPGALGGSALQCCDASTGTALALADVWPRCGAYSFDFEWYVVVRPGGNTTVSGSKCILGTASQTHVVRPRPLIQYRLWQAMVGSALSVLLRSIVGRAAAIAGSGSPPSEAPSMRPLLLLTRGCVYALGRDARRRLLNVDSEQPELSRQRRLPFIMSGCQLPGLVSKVHSTRSR
ncbi:hypothetical protein C2E23DRAFT_482968 [Lenzites betulinus]|nr:hypothetical protein C2E23DRAFT_482968 [Lenzites betulinus]